MHTFKDFLIILWGLFFLFLIFLILKEVKYKLWLKKLKKTPIKKEYLRILQTLPEYTQLNNNQKTVLNFKIQRFIKEKNFIGIQIQITEEIKTITAFYACLPTIAYEYFCYPSLKNIYVYPHTIILNSKAYVNGIVSEENMLISGEAIGESVVIVWNEAKKEIYHNLGRNVIIHEFAHELDFEEGNIDGIPPIPKAQYKEWNKIMFEEFEKFQKKLLKNRLLGKYSFLDRYAATNKAEFFAVLSEYYFKKPEILKKHFPDIYKELKKFYKVELNVRENNTG